MDISYFLLFVSQVHRLDFGFKILRLNLINHLFGFISAKFACILAISNPIFRWESCKGSEWENVKKCSRLCKDAETHGWTCGWLTTGKPPKLAHVWSMQGSWRVMPAVVLQDKSLNLARPLARGLNLWLSPVARPSH